jgi:hypothetical protein
MPYEVGLFVVIATRSLLKLLAVETCEVYAS